MLLSHFVALLLFAPFFVHSVPVSTSAGSFQCPETCSGENSLVDFGVLRTHSYEFKIEHVISSPALSHSQSFFGVSGNAIISGGVNCTYELQLTDVRVFKTEMLQKTPIMQETGKILEEHRTFFGFDGEKVTGFCPSKSEKPFAWNIKAAILSHLQADLMSISLPSETIEEDISGKCLTRYEVIERSEEGLTFVKSKPTAGCGGKYNVLSSYNGILDPNPSAGTKEGMVEGKQECRVSVNFEKPISSSSCEETFVINDPERNLWQYLNKIQVTTSLKLVSSSSSGSLEIDGPENYLHSPLTYHESFLTPPSRRAEPLETLPMKKDSRFLSQVIREMESYSKEDFDTLKKFADNEEDMKFLIDAAIHVRTEASLNFLEWCLENVKFQFPIGQMSMVTRPSLTYIQAAKKALIRTTSKVYRMVMSNLLKSYCDRDPQCTTHESIIGIMKSLEEPILNGCKYSTPNELDEIIDSLRAIGNLGKITNKSAVYPALKDCLTPSPNRDPYVHISAAEAFLRFPPDDEADDILLKVVGDTNQDDELRIQAFRSYIRQLTAEKFLRLEQLLEEYDQVKAYILSYYNEILKSQDLSKQDEALILQKLYKPRGSRNFFNSFYYEKFFNFGGYGAGMESSVIYDPQSPIPRSVDLNYTMNYFGYSFNILQLKYRSKHSRGIRKYFMRSGMNDKVESNDSRSLFAIRMFDRDIAYFDDIDSNNEFSNVASSRNSLILSNETFTFPTIGGVLIQINNLLPICQKLTNAWGENNKYGIEMNYDAFRNLEVGLITNEGLLGFKILDVVEMNVPFMIKARFRPGDFALGILGTGKKFTAFKHSRSLVYLSSDTQSPPIPSIYEDTPRQYVLPQITKIIGLNASYWSTRLKPSGVVTEQQLEVERFDGLLITFNKLENTDSFLHYSKSMNFGIQSYAPTDPEDPYLTSDLTNKLVGVKYKHRKIGNEWSTFASLDCYQKSFNFSVNSSGEGELEGVVHLGDWTAKVSGNVQQVGASDYEMLAQFAHPDYSLVINQQTSAGKSYSLAAESTSHLLPFVFKTSTEYGNPKSIKHHSLLKLPDWRDRISLETELRWDPRDILGMLNLEVERSNSRRRLKGEVVAKRDYGHRYMTTPQAYNYTLSMLLDNGGDSEPWSFGSSVTKNITDTSKMNFDLKFWAQRYSANLHASTYSKSTYVRAYEATVDVKDKNTNLFESKGVLNMNGAVLLNGTFNTSLHSPLVCQGEPNRLNVFISLENLVKSLDADFLCGESMKYKLSYSLDLHKQIYSMNLTDHKGIYLRVHSPYTLKVVSGRIQSTSESSIYIGSEHMYTIYEKSTFSPREISYNAQTKRITDETIISTADFNALVWKHVGLKIDLPSVKNGFLLDTGLTADIDNYRELGAKFILGMDSQKYGFDLAFSKGRNVPLPIALNATFHGFEQNRSFIVNFDAGSGDEDYKQAGLFVKTHANDEVILKISKAFGNKANEGELSLYFSIHPGTRKPNFGGFLYKTQVSWIFTPQLLKVVSQGEWNGNKATPPGMPFRYGIQVSRRTEVSGFEIQVYAEDTNMGKLFGNEMVEILYIDKLELEKGALEMEINLLLNWRKYLGRGVVGSQATLNLQLDKPRTDGSAVLVWTLPDDKQTQIVAEADFKIINQALIIGSKAVWAGENVHQGKLKCNREGSLIKIDIGANLLDLSWELQYEGRLDSLLSIDIDASAKMNKQLQAEFILSASDKKPPKIKIYVLPNRFLNSFSAKVESKTLIANTSPTNFDVEGYFKSEPIFLNGEFKFKFKDQRVFKTKTVIMTALRVSHSQKSTFEISEDEKSFALNINIDSPLITNGKMKISKLLGCTSVSDYNLQCVRDKKRSLNIDSKEEFGPVSVSLKRKKSNWTSIDVKTDTKAELKLISNDKEFGFLVKQGDATIFHIKLLKEVDTNKSGSAINLHGLLEYDKSTLETKIGISNKSRFLAYNISLTTSGEVGKHEFDLKANVGYILSLLANGKPSELDRYQLKTYLLHFDDFALGLEFTDMSHVMITYVNSSVNMRCAYDWRTRDSFRIVLQADAPIEMDARALFNFAGESYLALSKASAVKDTVAKTDLTNLLGGSSKEFVSSGCASNPTKCQSIILGSTSTNFTHSQRVFNIIVSICNDVNPIVMETKFNGSIPHAISLMIKDREVGLGGWIDLAEGTITVETTWYRRLGGILLVKIGRREVAIENLDNRIEIGISGNRFELSSCLLEDPIVCVYNKDGIRKSLKLYRKFVNSSTILGEFSTMKTGDYCKNIQIIAPRSNDKLITMDAKDHICQSKEVIILNVNILGRNGELYMEFEPGKKTFMKLNDDIIFSISNENHLNGRNGNAVLQYRGGTEKIEAGFRTSNNPVQIFAFLKAPEGEAVLEGKMTSLMNVFGQIWHSYNDSEKVLDAEIFTYLDDKSGVYHFNEFWRRDLLFDIFVGGLKNCIATKIPYLIGEIEEVFVSPFVEEIILKEDLLNRTMLEETVSIVKSFADELYDKTIESINYAQAWFTKLDARELLYPEMITKILQSIQSHAQKPINSTKNLLSIGLFKAREAVYHLYKLVSSETLSIDSAITRTADQIVTGFNELFHKIPGLQISPDIMRKMDYELQEATLNMNRMMRSNESVIGRNLRCLLLEEAIKAYTLNGNWSEITVNASLYIPPLALRLAAPITPNYLGIPMADVPEDRFWLYFQPLRRFASANHEVISKAFFPSPKIWIPRYRTEVRNVTINGLLKVVAN
nr:Lipid transport protein N terminal [Hymenolepis microstoma]